MNQICLVGRLTGDPSSKQFGERVVAEFSIAVNRNKKDETDFFNVKVWGKSAEFVLNYLRKGRLVSVSGRMESRKYEKDGRNTTFWEVNADSVNGLDRGDSNPQPQTGSQWKQPAPPPPLPGEIEDPFAD